MKKRSLLLIVILVCGAVVGLVFAGKAIFGGESQSDIDSLIDYTKGDQAADAQHEHGTAEGQHEHKAEAGHEPPRNVRVSDFRLRKAATYSRKKGDYSWTIGYTLPETAGVIIKVVKQGTRELYLATILELELHDKGTYTETWDGLDYSGNPVDMTKASMFIRAIAGGSLPGDMPLEKLSPEEVVHSKKHGEWGHNHTQHHEWAEEVPTLKIVNISKDAVLSGVVLIKSEVDKEKRGYGNQYGYGVRYYVDSTLAHEEFYKPESDGQFAYELDTTAFEDGEHMLYVGMCDHNEHTTSAGVKVKFANLSKSE